MEGSRIHAPWGQLYQRRIGDKKKLAEKFLPLPPHPHAGIFPVLPWFSMTQSQGCPCDPVAILATTLNLFPPSLPHFPFPITPATSSLGEVCLRALFSREVSQDNASVLTQKSFWFRCGSSFTRGASIDNGSGIIAFITRAFSPAAEESFACILRELR